MNVTTTFKREFAGSCGRLNECLSLYKKGKIYKVATFRQNLKLRKIKSTGLNFILSSVIEASGVCVCACDRRCIHLFVHL